MRIDIHKHIIPEHIHDFSKKFGYEGFVSMANRTSKNADMMIFGEKFRTIKCNCWSAKERISDMKKHKIDMQVLSPTEFSNTEPYLTDSVPTGIAINNDGTIYVSIFGGFPYFKGSGKILQIKC